MTQYYERWPDYLFIYTDGTRQPTGTGSAFVIPKLNYKEHVRLPLETSIFTCEIYAIYLALKYASTLSDTHILILSDSQAAIYALTMTDRKLFSASPYIVNTLYLISLFHKNGRTIHLTYISAHNFSKYNQIADQHAKSAIQLTNTTDISLHWYDLLYKIKKKVHQQWLDWLQAHPQHATQLNRPHLNLSLTHTWFHKTLAERKATILLCRLRSSHTTLADHLFKIHLAPSPYCDCSHNVVPQTLNHIFFSCTKFARDRTALLRILSKMKFQSPLSINYLLSQPTLKLGYVLLHFLRQNNLLL